jgi:hypothetical protein
MRIQVVRLPRWVRIGWYDVPGAHGTRGFRGWLLGWYEVRFRRDT